MPLIKSSSAPATAIAFSLRDVEQHARQLIARAKEDAQKILDEARIEAEQLKLRAHDNGLIEGKTLGIRQGREEGLKAGRDDALAQHREQLSQAVSALKQAATEIDRSRHDLHEEAVNDVLELAIAIARRVTKLQGVRDPQVAVANVTEAMKLVSHASDIRIAIHPDQKSTLDAALPALRLEWPQLRHVEIVEDAALTPGSCRLFTAQGQVDGEIEEQLERIVSDLVPAREGSPS